MKTKRGITSNKQEVLQARGRPPIYNVYEFVPQILIGVTFSQPSSDHSSVSAVFEVRNWAKVEHVAQLNKMVMSIDEFKFLFSDGSSDGGSFGNIETYRDSYNYLVVRYVKRKLVPSGAIYKPIKFATTSYRTLKEACTKMISEIETVLQHIRRPTPDMMKDKRILSRILQTHLNNFYTGPECEAQDSANIKDIFKTYFMRRGIGRVNSSLIAGQYPPIAQSLLCDMLKMLDEDECLKTITNIHFCDPAISWLISCGEG